ncbi:MAG TPA: FecR domain-containing protein [Puia sp.]|nr:FecR domain-containing protein [Puia sp.]
MENQRFEELLIGELAGELTAAERQELLDLLTTNEEFRAEHETLKDFWTQKEPDYADMRLTLEKIKAEIRRQEHGLEIRPDASPSTPAAPQATPDASPVPEFGPRRRIRPWWTWSVAASLLLLLGSYGIYLHNKNTANGSLSWQEKYTPRNARSRMTLTDGSSVTLNSDSRLKYPVSFDGPAREVYLTGEAYFTIAKDAAHPFIIHTNKMTIRVLGTSFNVRCYPDDDVNETTLIQGSIEVTFPDRPADKIILKPTDKLVIRNDKAAQPAGRPADPPGTAENPAVPTQAAHTNYSLTGLTYYRNQRNTIVETSWMENKLVFNAEELQSVARKMERWYGVSIVIDNEELKTLPFTGLFQNETIDEALYALQLSEKKLHYTKKDTVIHIY